MKKVVLALVFVSSVAVLLCTIPATSALAQDVPLYTTQNIWYEKSDSLWCINFKKGTMISAGTEVENVKLVRSRARGADRHAISFTTRNDNRRYIVNFNRKYHPGKTVRDYMDLLFSPKPLSRLTEGMSQKEIDAIAKGVVVKGMSKKAVTVSYGLPPEHANRSLDSNQWVYWMSRFIKKEICFDASDKATPCASAEIPDTL